MPLNSTQKFMKEMNDDDVHKKCNDYHVCDNFSQNPNVPIHEFFSRKFSRFL